MRRSGAVGVDEQREEPGRTAVEDSRAALPQLRLVGNVGRLYRKETLGREMAAMKGGPLEGRTEAHGAPVGSTSAGRYREDGIVRGLRASI